MRGLLGGKDQVLHETVFSEHGPRIMARSTNWKLVFYPGEEYGELYDLREDPNELYNLYAKQGHADNQHAIVERMMHWLGTTRTRKLQSFQEGFQSRGAAYALPGSSCLNTTTTARGETGIAML